MRKYKPTAKSYFSGAGLFDIGIKQAGVKIIQSIDIDKRATACMQMNRHYFNHEILTEDIKEVTVLDQPKSDIIYFTYPCDKYSDIADIHRVRTGDELFLHAFRHIVLEQPEMFWGENVPGMLKFKVVMEAMTKLPGYYITTFCPVNASLWLPQDRKRVIIVGTKKPFNIASPESKRRRSLKSIIESDPEVDMPNYVISRLNGNYRDLPIIVNPEDANAIAPTCVAHYAKDRGTRLLADKKFKHGVRPFSIREYARLQGVPDDYKFPSTLNAYGLIGNGVPVHIGRWIGKEAIKYFN
jgi:DNA (cytosine-5)-methyltransferase 1